MVVPPSEIPPDETTEVAPTDPRYRRYWNYYNRPYVGCGFLWMALLLLVIYFLLSLFFPSLVPSVY